MNSAALAHLANRQYLASLLIWQRSFNRNQIELNFNLYRVFMGLAHSEHSKNNDNVRQKICMRRNQPKGQTYIFVDFLGTSHGVQS